MLHAQLLPMPIRFAILSDLGMNAGTTLLGSHHLLIDPNPITQFGVLIAIGLLIHEITPVIWVLTVQLRRWRRHRR